MKKVCIHILHFKILILFGIIVLMVSCGKENGDIITQDIDLPTFNSIELNAVFDVEIMEDEHFTLQIIGVQGVTQDLTYKVENQKLILDNVSSNLWLHPKNDPPKLIIMGKGITLIEANETCNIKSLNTITTDTFGILLGSKLNIASLQLDCKLFYYWNTSPLGGMLTLKGKSDAIQIYNGELMAVDASEFPCDIATVENGSKADVRVFVRKRLDYSISGTGNIYVSGNPTEIVPGHLSSTGILIQ
jgi:hypothetical protein